jgi:oligoendopeptidase F
VELEGEFQMTQTTTLSPRCDVPVEETWDLQTVFPSVDAWKTTYREVESLLPGLSEYRGRLGESPKVLLDWFTAAERILRQVEKIYVYASLDASVDTTNQDATARQGQARSLVAGTMAACAFGEPEIMAIGFDTLREWMDSEPRLSLFAHYFDRLERQEAHVRSGEVEEVLATASDPLNIARDTYDLLANADLKFEPARNGDGEELEIGQSTIEGLISHPDRDVRRTAWQNYADGYLRLKNTLASALTATVKRDIFYARARKYGSSLEAALSPQNLPVEVFHNVIDVFHQNLSTWHRYWRVRRRAMGLENLHVYDIEAPLTANPPAVSFRRAVDWIAEGMRPLGREYVEALRRGSLDDRWVDYAVNKGKRAGAFSSGSYDTNPFILMSNTNDLSSLSTLAHELGHSLHTFFSHKAQPYIYSEYSLFAAEVASNFNQALTRAYLFETQTDRDFQLALIQETMSNFQRYFFIMPILAQFELEMHERIEKGEPINADLLIDLMADLFRKGYGDEIEFDHDRVGIAWAQFGHMYLNFYVYQYITGISGAHALAKRVLAGEEGAADRYLDFLRAGDSMYPLDALRRAGVDLTTPAPVEKTFEVLAEIVDRLESLTGSN